MRSTLIDWLNELSSELELDRETYHISVCLIDKFLNKSKCPIPRQNLQLVGITCLFLAIKLEVKIN